MRIQTQLCFLASLVLVINAVPILQTADMDEATAEDYLKSFYNLTDIPDVKAATRRGASPLTEKMKEMQKFFKLKVTGKLDKETLEVMKKPRCGVPDVSSYSTFEGRPKWQTNRITYRIVNYTPDLSRAEVDQSIDRALQVWAKVTPLRFTRMSSGTADIMISFVRGYHGDNSPFDGPGGTLAHAYAPSAGIGGDAHFDDDEFFTLRSQRGFILFLVAAHEFGHSLGLSHSNVRGALMYPTYGYKDPDRFPLSSDDVRGIQSLYGPSTDGPSIQPDPEIPTNPDACNSNLIFDAVTTIRGETLFFKDSLFWRSIPGREVMQIPIGIFWLGGPETVDAAYEDPVQDRIFFFKDGQVWAFYGNILEPGYPKSLSSFGLPPTVRKINAAVHDRITRTTFLFTDRLYYSYNEKTKKIDAGFPKRVEEGFPGVTGEVTAAHHTKGYINLFCGTKVFQFKSNNKRLVQVLKNNDFLPC